MSSEQDIKLSPSAIRLIECEYGFHNPRHAMAKLAHDLLVETRQTFPPIQFGPILKLRKTRVYYLSDDLDMRRKGLRDACLVPVDDGFALRLRPSRQLASRVRFSIAHEIGHTFFFDIYNNPPKKLSVWRGRTSDEEKLCDIFASELLMPQEMVRHFVAQCASLSLVGVVSLSRKFKTSYEAMSRRLIQDLELWRALVMGVCWLPKKHEEGTKDFYNEKWRVVWYSLPRQLESTVYIPGRGNRPSINQALAERIFVGSTPDDKAINYKLRLGNLDKFVESNDQCRLRALALKPQTLPLAQAGEVQDSEVRKRTEILIAIELP